ncbi:MAG: anhydro-N-acetylmuramic acid kinase [Cyanobacteriota bacterium]|nr:anhydro-N-acetylmuramic acid kinase [Cyanobacteriota bacterium]
MRVLGLMSGTSADGVDAVLASFSGLPSRPRWRILASASRPYPAELRQQLIAVGQGNQLSMAALLELAEAVTEQQTAAAQLCDPGGLAQLVGCHGQTLWHRPPAGAKRGASQQVLQGPLLASLLQRPVVFDFRAADLALGGQGAPLVPPADAALLGRVAGWRAVLNLGGIANLTLIPPAEGPERQASLSGWDCGPANTLLDLAVQQFSGGRLHCDEGGAWAAQGRPDETLISSWLQHPYLQQQPPKSTGRELFGQADLQRRLAAMAELNQADQLATLTAFSAACVAHDLQVRPPRELLVAGGGCRNATLMSELRRRCRGTIVRPLAELGIADQQREALAFALLAWWHQRRHPGNAISVTGARRPAVLGVCALPA